MRERNNIQREAEKRKHRERKNDGLKIERVRLGHKIEIQRVRKSVLRRPCSG